MANSFQPYGSYLGNPVLPLFVINGAPTSGRHAQACPKGALVLDVVGGVIYQNTGTLDSPTYAIFGSTLAAALDASALPTSDPHVAGRVWSNSGVLTKSAG